MCRSHKLEDDHGLRLCLLLPWGAKALHRLGPPLAASFDALQDMCACADPASGLCSSVQCIHRMQHLSLRRQQQKTQLCEPSLIAKLHVAHPRRTCVHACYGPSHELLPLWPSNFGAPSFLRPNKSSTLLCACWLPTRRQVLRVTYTPHKPLLPLLAMPAQYSLATSAGCCADDAADCRHGSKAAPAFQASLDVLNLTAAQQSVTINGSPHS